MNYARALLSLSLLLSTCVGVIVSAPVSVAEAAEHRGVIAGTVKDSTTDKPLENALVVVHCECLSEPIEALSNARGFYTVDELLSGSYTVEVFAGGGHASRSRRTASRRPATRRCRPSRSTSTRPPTRMSGAS